MSGVKGKRIVSTMWRRAQLAALNAAIFIWPVFIRGCLLLLIWWPLNWLGLFAANTIGLLIVAGWIDGLWAECKIRRRCDQLERQIDLLVGGSNEERRIGIERGGNGI